MLQYSAVGNYFGQPFYLCGTDFDDKTDISELTLLILEVYDKLNLYNPKIQVKIDFNTNPKIIMRVLKMIRAGHSSFVFCCLPGITKSLMSCYGVTEEKARHTARWEPDLPLRKSALFRFARANPRGETYSTPRHQNALRKRSRQP